MKKTAVLCLSCASVLAPSLANAATFEAGSLVIPMDTDYQDMGTLEAFGLVYQLLLADVHVHWVIRAGKLYGEEDFFATAIDLQTNAAIVEHGYRGGLWVIDVADADAAKVVIDNWHAQFPIVAVHEVTASFDGDIARTLVVAPTIAMLADGNQDIARDYLLAARIADSTGDPLWPNTSPDMLDIDELAGPSDVDHADGALFDGDGNPLYCQLMSMHWGINDAEDNPEVVAEVRQYLTNPVHFFAECQAVNALENLRPARLLLDRQRIPHWSATRRVRLLRDGHALRSARRRVRVGWRQRAGVHAASGRHVQGTGHRAHHRSRHAHRRERRVDDGVPRRGLPAGRGDRRGLVGVWDTPGPAQGSACLTAGKVSYLGGHRYDVDVPISQNPTTQGARLFLNSLFEAPCATVEGFPTVTLAKSAPAFTLDANVTFVLDYQNQGPLPVLDVVLNDDLPAGSTFAAASDNGMLVGNTVVWTLGNLGSGQGGSVDFTVTLPELGDYENVAYISYRVGLNDFQIDSNPTVTNFGEAPASTSGSSGSQDGSGSTSASEAGSADDSTSSASGSGSVSDSAADSASVSDSAADSASSSNSGSASGSDSASDATATDGTGMTTAGSAGSSESGSAGTSDDSGPAGCGCSAAPGGAGWIVLGLFGVGRRRASRGAPTLSRALPRRRFRASAGRMRIPGSQRRGSSITV